MANWRMLATLGTQFLTLTINGREYSVGAGTALDVPDADVSAFTAAGYTLVAQSGLTAARPSAAGHSIFYDLTLSALIVSDGAVWRNPNGAAV